MRVPKEVLSVKRLPMSPKLKFSKTVVSLVLLRGSGHRETNGKLKQKMTDEMIKKKLRRTGL